MATNILYGQEDYYQSLESCYKKTITIYFSELVKKDTNTHKKTFYLELDTTLSLSNIQGDGFEVIITTKKALVEKHKVKNKKQKKSFTLYHTSSTSQDNQYDVSIGYECYTVFKKEVREVPRMITCGGTNGYIPDACFVKKDDMWVFISYEEILKSKKAKRAALWKN